MPNVGRDYFLARTSQLTDETGVPGDGLGEALGFERLSSNPLPDRPCTAPLRSMPLLPDR